ncbi:unnamed protein product [Mytilus edulis]|uniref:Uncharacterized protein n=1 Tax=Mytilus edulis TaxID=6550 RepID=A0A8S3R669_MYTED|nr:unnamed protein product [Mytilus edulis]
MCAEAGIELVVEYSLIKVMAYKLQVRRWILKGSYEFTTVYDIVQADYRNLFMVSVDLQSVRRKRTVVDNIVAEGFELSFSNDGLEFGNVVNVVVYDEQRFTCNATSKKCYQITSDVTTTESPETVTDIVKNPSNTLYVIIGTSCAVLLLAIIAIIISLKVRNAKSRIKIKTMKEDNSSET